MQGFNKYYPPDYDPEKHNSLNSYRGKHALGDRARKLDKGILITRFELPFNIWCGTCNNHIGMGVRYNAEKRKVGNYYSTPIYAFRCKCHLCDGWFEIQTDPKNTRYVITSGARQKDEEWDPEQNGGFAIHDPDAAGSSSSADPLASLEKTTASTAHMTQVQIPRIDALQALSERYNADPYAHSVRVRKRFRAEKKADLAVRAADDELKGQYALPETLKLISAEDEALRRSAKEEWESAHQERRTQEDSSKKRKLLAMESMSIPLASSLSSSSSRSLLPSSTSSKSLRPGNTGNAKPASNDAVLALRAKILGKGVPSSLSSSPSRNSSLLARQKPPDRKISGVVRRDGGT